MMMPSSTLHVFGDNRVGQAGIASGEDFIWIPHEVQSVGQGDEIHQVTCNSLQTFVVHKSGFLSSAGENDMNELGRGGKRSLFQRVDCLEAFQIVEAALGEGFFHLLTKDGSLISWGKNDMGQLGNGNRELREKPRPNPSNLNAIIQIACGQQHVLALTKNGNVVTWGGNRKGQLGDGQFVSCTQPKMIPQLRHRPIVSIACGENHSMVMTVSGNVYSWGDNANGQLGQGDTTPRFRPELIRAIRTSRAVKISCGKNHSAIIAQNGLLFTCGANTHGQCGLDPSIRLQFFPIVVDSLRDKRCLDVACGANHTLLLVERYSNGFDEKKHAIYVLGSNGCGQLGLGEEIKITSQPLQLVLPNGEVPSGIASSPLSMTAFVSSGKSYFGKKELPAVDACIIEELINKVKSIPAGTNSSNVHIRRVRECVSAAFSSLSVLNASFIDLNSIGHNKLCVNLSDIRSSYSLLMSVETQHPSIVTTLGRATLHLSDELRECPFDDAENLSVFFIVLENPLMLRASEFHIAIQQVIGSILGLPKMYRLLLFKWFKSYPSEFFGRVIQILQNYISFALENKTANLDPTPAVLVLETLFECNEAEQIVPHFLFYNSSISKKVNLINEWNKLKSEGSNSQVFNFCSYPFLIDKVDKYRILQYENKRQMLAQVNIHNMRYGIGAIFNSQHLSLQEKIMKGKHLLPAGTALEIDDRGSTVVVDIVFNLVVRREHVLQDVVKVIHELLLSDPESLKLPLKVEFEGEIGLDRGGLAKELFTIAIRHLIQQSKALRPCANGRIYWFTKSALTTTSSPNPKQQRVDSHDVNFFGPLGPEHMLGLLAGLAVYNGIFINLPLPMSIYKVLLGKQLLLSDLWQADAELARGLKFILEYPEGLDAIETLLGTTFSASLNPLIMNRTDTVNGEEDLGSDAYRYVELLEGGSTRFVTRGNRQEYVELFVKYALCGSCNDAIDNFFTGFKMLLPNSLIELCAAEELEHIVCGSPDIGDLSELRLNTVYKGKFNDEHEIVNWFWDCLSNFNLQEKKKFLSFLTGSERVPIGGIASLGLVIQSTEQDESALPISHTCFNTLDIPSTYSSKDIFEEKFKIAVQHYEGFGLV